MQGQDHSHKSGAAGAADGGRLTYLDQALWKRLDSGPGEEPDLDAWLALQCGMIDGAAGGVLVLGPADVGPFKPVAQWPAGRAVSPLVSAAAETAVVRRRGIVQGEGGEEPASGPGPNPYGVAYPILTGGRLHGVVAVEIEATGEARLRAAMRQLQWGAAWVELLLDRRRARDDEGRRERVATALDLIASAIEEPGFRAAALAVVTELATRLGCERVSIGFMKRDRSDVVAISHTASFNRRSELVRRIAAAMDEALDQRASIVCPAPPDTPLVIREHKALAEARGAGAIVTVPLFAGAHYFGALTLELPGGREPDPGLVELVETVGAVVGPVLHEKRQNDRPLPAKIAASAAEQLHRLVGPRYLGRKMAVAVLLLVTAFFAFVTWDYRVSAEAVLEGELQRVVAAPMDGYLADAAVRAGDTVTAGEVLASMDDRELVLERQRWLAQQRQDALEYDQAMARGQRSEAQVIRARMAQAEAQLGLIEAQLGRAVLTAPFDGVVISGDLSQSIGKALRRGEPLFEIAPLASYRVVLKVDETEIDEIAPGQAGHLVIASMPEARFGLVVDEVTPVSVAEEGRNYFRVEASLTDPSERLRPGMSGVGKVNVGERKLIWIWTHRALDWLRLKLWAWSL